MSGGRSDITIPAMPLIHTGFAVSTVVLCVVVWSLRATSYFGDALEAQYWAACAFAAMSFGVGTLMVELFRGDIVGASLGRVLVGLSVLIMAAKAHEFMEQAQECLIANVQQAKPVANEAMLTTVTATTKAGNHLEWSNENGRWFGPVSVVYRQSGREGIGVGRGNRSVRAGVKRLDCVPGGASREPTATDGTAF